MDEENVFFASGTNYMESLINSRSELYSTKEVNVKLVKQLDEVISLELELARIGAEKALSEVRTAKLTPLKGGKS
jgi:hypothetical protein